MFKTRKALAALGIIAILAAYSGTTFASSEGADVSPDAALAKLMDGNKRFVEGKQAQKDIGDNRRTELTKGQHPFAVILSCSDSRVPPEHIFDQGLGDIFVVRVAGNIADSVELGSVEYAVEHLGSPLILVLGHQMCGAVKATVAGGKPEGNIGSIVKKIAPAVKKAKAQTKDKDKLLDAAILENTKNTATTLTQKSAIIKHLVEGKKVKIAAGVYNLATGRVELVEASSAGRAEGSDAASQSHEHAHAEHSHAGH
ncbi:MAG: carbonic anhydrase [Deltaproteobacteria bacterium]|nr:carbonic anhydrase [Deltaproteobacteria bacterium]